MAAKEVTAAQDAAEAAIQKAIADRDRILNERAADMRLQMEQAKADAQAQVKAIQHQADVERAVEPDQTTLAQQRPQARLAAARPPRSLSKRRTPKMTPELLPGGFQD